MITRKPIEISFRFEPDGSIAFVTLQVRTADSDEDTVSPGIRDFRQPGVVARATALYDQIAALASLAGKPLTFTGTP